MPRASARRVPVGLGPVLLLVGMMLGSLAFTTSPAAAASCGAVQVASGQWLGGHGVDVHSNGADQGTGDSCAGWSTSSPSVQDGYGWQCVELASRLYAVNGWGSVHANGGSNAGTYQYGAKYIPEGSPSLTFHPNGSGYIPVPGDLIVEWSSTWGHVAIVDSVVGGTVNAVEQNASASGRHTYTLSGSTLTGAYSGNVRGVMHSPANNATSNNTTGGYEAAFQANTGDLWTVGNDGHGSWNLGMMAGTSPGVALLAGGGYEVAFQANTGDLWTAGPSGAKDWHLGMLPGTSPSIAPLTNGGYEVAFQANTGNLWTVGSSDSHGDWNLGMMAGTSPSVVGLNNGGYEVAFQANTGNLWTVGNDSHGDWNLGMMKRTSPSLAALSGGGYVVAFQANTGNLWTVGPSDSHGDWNLGMMAGTSPGITGLSNGGYEVAFQANTGDLWTVGSDSHGEWNLGMMSGTSPAIAGVAPSGYEVAFQANTGNLWTVGSNDSHGDWHLGMMSGTTPCVAGAYGQGCSSNAAASSGSTGGTTDSGGSGGSGSGGGDTTGSTSGGQTALSSPTSPRDAAASPTSGRIRFAWTAPADTGGGQVQYRVQWSPCRFSKHCPTVVRTTDNLRVLVRNLHVGHLYYFRVRAENVAGHSPYTRAVSSTAKQG